MLFHFQVVSFSSEIKIRSMVKKLRDGFGFRGGGKIGNVFSILILGLIKLN